MRLVALSLCSAFGVVAAAAAQHAAVVPATRLSVFVVGAKSDENTTALLEIARTAGHLPRLVERAACAPESLRTADVVIVDWPATEALGERLPLGEFARWDRPTLLLGAAGDVFAQRWGLPTAAQMAAMPENARGPEMQEVLPAGDTKLAGWRQGNLFHVALPVPVADLPAAERMRLLALVANASTVVTDRPILRYGASAGGDLPVPESARRERIAAASKQLGIDPTDRAALLVLPERHRKGDFAPVAQLLTDLVPESEADTSTNWILWLKPRKEQLVWDPLSHAWRIDPLSRARLVPSQSLRGDARADGGERDEKALALAAKVVQHHGGRALADLATFSCWIGGQHCMWDRRRGYFRVENHHVIAPGALGTAWKVAVIDTAADVEVIWGGGPPPRPRVSARSTWREVVERLFLPAMLLDPGIALRRLPDQDADGKQALAVRMCGRGMDVRSEYVMLVDPETGAIAAGHRLPRSAAHGDTRIAATAACGPLLLPVEQVDEHRNGPRRWTASDVKWNPELPADLATATGQFSEPRAK